jgi:hypothetical protein
MELPSLLIPPPDRHFGPKPEAGVNGFAFGDDAPAVDYSGHHRPHLLYEYFAQFKRNVTVHADSKAR